MLLVSTTNGKIKKKTKEAIAETGIIKEKQRTEKKNDRIGKG